MAQRRFPPPRVPRPLRLFSPPWPPPSPRLSPPPQMTRPLRLFPPFLDATPFVAAERRVSRRDAAPRLLAVAMMRRDVPQSLKALRRECEGR